jgi:hypothetical protein
MVIEKVKIYIFLAKMVIPYKIRKKKKRENLFTCKQKFTYTSVNPMHNAQVCYFKKKKKKRKKKAQEKSENKEKKKHDKKKAQGKKKKKLLTK